LQKEKSKVRVREQIIHTKTRGGRESDLGKIELSLGYLGKGQEFYITWRHRVERLMFSSG